MNYKFIVLFLMAFALKLQGQQIQKTNVLFLIDASYSMRKNWETKSKWTIAKETVVDLADSLKNQFGEDLRIGIRVYGHQSLPIASNCEDTELLVPIAENSSQLLQSRLASINPKGITPLAYSLEKTKTDFAKLKGKNILILITDGYESCQGDPCYILNLLLKNKIILKPFIIGLDIDIESLKSYKCLNAGLFNQKSQKDFKSKLHLSLKKALKYTSLQVRLLNHLDEAKQTDIAMFFYSKSNNELKHIFYHKLQKSGEVDTLYIEPGSYKIVVKTIPEVHSEYFNLDPSGHNVVDIKIPTGILNIQQEDQNNQKIEPIVDVKYVIKNFGVQNYLHQEWISKPQEYLSGTYDIDVLTLPVIQLKNQKIESEQTKSIEIPAAGTLALKTKYPIHGALFVKNVDSLINIYSLPPKTTQETLALQPGTYQLVYRLSNEQKMINTKSISFTINSLQTTNLNL